jgi:hypothetical protein
MIRVPKGLMTFTEAARKYGFSTVTLRDYATRKRLQAVKIGWIWYTTDQAMKQYLKSRDIDKIPKKYRGRKN